MTSHLAGAGACDRLWLRPSSTKQVNDQSQSPPFNRKRARRHSTTTRLDWTRTSTVPTGARDFRIASRKQASADPHPTRSDVRQHVEALLLDETPRASVSGG